MKYLILIASVIFSDPALSAEKKASWNTFLITIEDVPLAPGMKEINSAQVIFETASGRIAEAQATGKKASKTVRDFYRKTLPQLGWQRINEGIYHRENEVLKIEINVLEDDGTLIIFSLKPINS